MIEAGLNLKPTSNQFNWEKYAAIWDFFGMDWGNTTFIVCAFD